MAIAAATCAGTGGAYDFNGDRHRDIAIADPGANDGAGRIIVQYEGINVTQTIDQNAASNNLWGAEAGDQFGYSMDVVDWNSDGCTDLLVGVPYEDLANGGRDHGMVHLIYGSPDGLGKGKASENWSQDSDAAGFGDAAENRDHFGYAVAASRTAANQPYLLIGVPGEDHFGHWDAGLVHVLRGTANYAMWSGNGIPGAAALNDQVGYSLDAATHHFVLGRPGDTIGDRPFAGSAQVFSSTAMSGSLPKLVADLSQDSKDSAGREVDGVAGRGDQWGKSVAIIQYTGTATSLLAIGVPNEDVNNVQDAGMVQRFVITDTTSTVLSPVTEATAGIGGDPERGGYFGFSVRMVNHAEPTPVTDDTLLLAVGAPGKDVGGARDAGTIRVFRGGLTSIPSDVGVDRNTALPGEPRAGEMIGMAMSMSGARLHVGTPTGEDKLYGVLWSTVAVGTPDYDYVFPNDGTSAPAGSALLGWTAS
ncbi:hypothetical protein J2S41_005556 [Catenuloplanes atrovinosus]|uniref:Uncharacterized protein n=2 Tax=Catenuloplanes atrovinosus TaxID=137266 RepID=A0AAE3YUU1_9ACTN|nr:hypothetical protein [Catenuloplanes atrovinosus]